MAFELLGLLGPSQLLGVTPLCQNLLQGIKGVSVYIDDILITGPTLHDHLQFLNTEAYEESKEYVTVNTHKGLYRYNRLPFAPHQFSNGQ